LGRDVIYPDFTMDRTRDWWKDALNRFIVKDENMKLDGIFLVGTSFYSLFFNILTFLIFLKGLYRASK
jgi:hypothetical protein